MKFLLLFIAAICFTATNISAQKTKATHSIKKYTIPFQGKRHFCSDESRMTYDVEIKGNKVIITYPKFKATGYFKNGLVFTNDPQEVEYRNAAGKYNYGKYYIIEAEYFSVLLTENGEYNSYNRCTLKEQLEKNK